MTALRPFFSYMGSKYQLAKLYPEPRHSTIVEPFAGSAGYSLRYPDRDGVLVERYPILCEIWKWLINASPDDIRSLPGHLKAGDTIADYDLPRPAKWLM